MDENTRIVMDKTKCITFDPVAQEALPDHIKAKMKADSERARTDYAYCKNSYENEGMFFDRGYIEAIHKGHRLFANENWRSASVSEVRDFFNTQPFRRPKGRYFRDEMEESR